MLHPSHPENLSPVWAPVGKDPLCTGAPPAGYERTRPNSSSFYTIVYVMTTQHINSIIYFTIKEVVSGKLNSPSSGHYSVDEV